MSLHERLLQQKEAFQASSSTGGDGGDGRAVGDKRLVPSDTAGFLNEQVWDGSRWITIDFVRAPADSGGGGAAGRTQFESERQLDLANAQATLQQAQASLANAETARRSARTAAARQEADLRVQQMQLKIDVARINFDKAQAKIGNKLAQDTLNASIAATKQRLDEIKLEAELAFKAEDALLTKRLEAEREMLTLRLDNDFRELLFSEIGAERRTLIQEQGETRRLAAELQGKDPFRQASLLGGQAQRGRTPAARFGQENQAFLNQPLPQANFGGAFPTGGAGTGDPAVRAATLAALQAQLTGAQNRPLQPQAPVAGLAQGGTFSMRGPTQSFLVGEVGGRVIPGITETMTIGGGKVTVSPIMGGFQEGGTVLAEGTIINIDDRNSEFSGNWYIVQDGKLRLIGLNDVRTFGLVSDQAVNDAGFATISRMGFGSFINSTEAQTIFGTTQPEPAPTPAPEPAPEPAPVPPTGEIPVPPSGDVEPSPLDVPPVAPPLREEVEPPVSGPTPDQIIKFSDSPTVYYWDATLGVYRTFTNAQIFSGSGFSGSDVVVLDSSERDALNFGPPITEAFGAEGPTAPNLIRFSDSDTVYIWDAEAQGFRSVGTQEIFNESGLSNADIQVLSPADRAQFTILDDPLTEPFDETTDPRIEPPVVAPPVVEPPVVAPPPPVDTGPTQQDILAGLQALAPGFAGLSQFVPRTQEGQFGGTNALRDFFSFQGQNLVQDPFSGQFRPFLPGLPEGTTPQSLLNAPTSFGAPVVNQGAFNLQNLSTLGFDPALVRLGGQEDIFYRDPTTGELRQFGTPDIFEQSGFNLQDVFNISPTGQNFQFGNPITSPLPLDPNSNTVGPFRTPLIDPLTGALLFDPFQNAQSLLQLFQENPTSFNNLLSSFGTAGLDPTGFQSRLDLATPTGRLDNPFRIGFTGTRL